MVRSVATSSASFTGFGHEALQFLVDLAGNNERPWFQAHKQDYERLLKQPLEALCVALADRFSARNIPLSADPARSPFRIYRDVRFAKDKSPYKTHIAASFPWVGEGTGVDEAATTPPASEGTARTGGLARIEGPARTEGTARTGGSLRDAGGYFHLSVESTFVGGGMWHPEPARLAAFRTAVLTRPQRVLEAIEEPGFVRVFGSVRGDQLKRPPQGVPKDHPQVELLKLKDVGFWRELTEEQIASPRLPDLLADTYAAALPVFRLLARL